MFDLMNFLPTNGVQERATTNYASTICFIVNLRDCSLVVTMGGLGGVGRARFQAGAPPPLNPMAVGAPGLLRIGRMVPWRGGVRPRAAVGRPGPP